jgi:hypothetical protein
MVYFSLFNLEISDISQSLDWKSNEVILALFNYQVYFLRPNSGGGASSESSGLTRFQAGLYLHLAYYLILVVLSLFVTGRRAVMRAEMNKSLYEGEQYMLAMQDGGKDS